MAETKFPTETVTLPSKGLVYQLTDPLSKGEIEMKYMSAAEEDILTNSNYIRQGTVIDKLLQALIITPINYDNLIVGDKNAILVAARVLGYGKDYPFKYQNKYGEVEAIVDLSTIKDKEIDENLFKQGINEFNYELPHTGHLLTFKFLTHGDEKKIDSEIKGLKKLFPEKTFDVTTRLKYMITSVNGERELKTIREFVDTQMIAKDARAFREYYTKLSPDIDLTYFPNDENYTGEGIAIPINLNFFWPDAA